MVLQHAVINKTKATSLVLILLTLLSLVTPIASSMSIVTASEPEREKLVSEALALQAMLRRTLGLGIAGEVLKKVEECVNIDVQRLSIMELRNAIVECSRVLEAAGREVSRLATGEVSRGYAYGLRIALESRLVALEKLYNISLGDALKVLPEPAEPKELVAVLRNLGKLVAEVNAHRFAEKVSLRALHGLDVAVEKAEAVDVKKAVKELEKVSSVLNRTIERLEALGVPSKAIDSVRRALENIVVAREILSTVLTNITGIIVPVTAREKARETAEKYLEKMVEKLKEDVAELITEVDELIARALELNTTMVLEGLESIKLRLMSIAEELKQNVTIDRLSKITQMVASIRAELKALESEVEEQLKRWMPEVEVAKAFNATLRVALENLRIVKEIISYIENRTREPIFCIMVYPPPPICRYLEVLPKMLEKAKSTVAEAEQMIEKAKELYGLGKRVEALRLINRANAVLVVVRAQLEPIYRLLKASEKIPNRNEVEERLRTVDEKLKNIEKVLEDVRRRIERVRTVARAVLEVLLREVIGMVEQCKRMVEEARRLLHMNNLSEALEHITQIENILSKIEDRLNQIIRST